MSPMYQDVPYMYSLYCVKLESYFKLKCSQSSVRFWEYPRICLIVKAWTLNPLHISHNPKYLSKVMSKNSVQYELLIKMHTLDLVPELDIIVTVIRMIIQAWDPTSGLHHIFRLQIDIFIIHTIMSHHNHATILRPRQNNIMIKM